MNLVFDLGGVVVRWDPEWIVSSVFPDDRRRRLARSEILSHPDWLELDRGTLDYERAVERAVTRTGLSGGEVRNLLEAVPPSLVPIEEMVALLHRLHAGGNALYCLSNMGHASIEYLEKKHDFFRLFTGRVVSCRLKLCKPEPAIFEHLLREFALEPRETVFTDDVEANVAAARQLGIRAIRFQNAAQFERELFGLAGRA